MVFKSITSKDRPRLLTALVGFLLTPLLGLCALPGLAQELPKQHYSGFASLGLVSNDNDDLGFRRDVSQRHGSKDGELEWRTDSLLGLQWQGQWTQELETRVQFVVKDRVDNSLERSLQWGFVGYKPVDDINIRLGRMGADIFMLSEYRQVGYAYQWVRPPADYYGFISYYYFDGLDIDKRFDFGNSTLNIKTYAGRTKDTYPPNLKTSGSENFELEFYSAGIIGIYELDSWKFRLSLAESKVNNEIESSPDMFAQLEQQSVFVAWPSLETRLKELTNNLKIKDKKFNYQGFGIAYDDNTWWAQAELTRFQSDSKVIHDSDYFYVSFGRRINQFSIYTLKGRAKTQNKILRFDPPPIAALQPVSENLEAQFNSRRVDQNSIGLGVRWDFRSKMALKLQVDRFTIESHGLNLWLKEDTSVANKNHTANVISLSLDTVF